MAQNITIQGASYTAVPAVTLPKTGGGTARFDDVSMTTLLPSEAMAGKYFVLADGSLGTGTIIDGNNLEYGLTDGTLPLAGVAKAGYAEVE